MRKLRRTRTRQIRTNRRLRYRAVTAGAAAVVSLVTPAGLGNPPVPPADKHQAVIGEDTDGDLLTDREEMALGYLPFRNDQNRNASLDGAELASRFAQVIAGLPLNTEVTGPHQIYKEELLMFGLETCDVCGEVVNMGAIRIVNPRLGLDVQIPVLATHYMEHGAFSYAGEVNRGRTAIARLALVLGLRFPHEPDDHRACLRKTVAAVDEFAADANDLDGDLLTNGEELAAELNLYDADQDNNLVADGIQLAQRCAEAIENLPTIDPTVGEAKGIYKVSYMMRGLEWCEICGESVNMGYWQIVNTEAGTSLEVSEIARHFMEHGSFDYLGDVHGRGRTEVAALLEVLGLPAACGDLGIPYDPADLNQDCRIDIEDFTEFAERWLDAIEPTDE
ncbi:MAG: hypothetical protein JSW27_13710 [Phycisphaerales bacterium]|nr:MAG: hypothetical protein JSW27_13710 [Phycisphaerales bacterium]